MKGRMMLCIALILGWAFSPTSVTSSVAEQAGIASVYSHESGSATASGGKLNREALTAAHRTLPFGSKAKIRNKSNGRIVIGSSNDPVPFLRAPLTDASPPPPPRLRL